MAVENIDEFYGDLRDKLKEACDRNSPSVRISLKAEAALRNLINQPDQNLGAEEDTHRNIDVVDIYGMLETLKAKLPELRRGYMTVASSNRRLPVDWGQRELLPMTRPTHLKLIFSR